MLDDSNVFFGKPFITRPSRYGNNFVIKLGTTGTSTGGSCSESTSNSGIISDDDLGMTTTGTGNNSRSSPLELSLDDDMDILGDVTSNDDDDSGSSLAQRRKKRRLGYEDSR